MSNSRHHLERDDEGFLEGSDDGDIFSPPPPPPAAHPDYHDDYNDNDSEYSFQCDVSISNSSKLSTSSVVERSNMMMASRREKEELMRRQLRDLEEREIQSGNL